MELRTISADDLALYEALLCDPVMTAELGGAVSKEQIPQIFGNALEFVETGRGWVLKITPEIVAQSSRDQDDTREHSRTGARATGHRLPLRIAPRLRHADPSAGRLRPGRGGAARCLRRGGGAMGQR